MSTSKRIISLLLALVMVLSILPWDILGVEAAGLVETVRLSVESAKVNGANPSAMAENNSDPTENTEPGDGVEVTRAQWLQMLVETFSMTVDNGIYPDNYFRDLSQESEYYYDMLLAIEFGVIDIPAGGELFPEEAANREFAAQTLNYCLGYQLDEGAQYTFAEADTVTYLDDIQVAINRNWFALEDSRFLPKQAITADEAQIMIADAEAYLEEQIIDDDYDNQYSFQSDIIEVPETVDVQLDVGTTYTTITMAQDPVGITNGSKFVVYYNGMPLGYMASSVLKTGTSTIIQATELSFEETFTTMDVEYSTDADISEFEAAEGAQVQYIDDETEIAYATAIEVQSAIQSRGSVKIPTIRIVKEVDLGDGLSVSVNANIKNAKFHSNTNFGWGKTDVSVWLTADVESSLQLKGDLAQTMWEDGEVVLGYWPVAGFGYIEVALEFELSGAVSVTQTHYVKNGMRYKSGEGLSIIREYKARSFSFAAEATASAALSIEGGVKAHAIPIEGYIFANLGFRANLASDGVKCVDFKGYMFVEVGAKCKVLNYSKTLQIDLVDENNSPIRVIHHYENGKLVPGCTNGGGMGGYYGNGDDYYTPGDSAYWGSGWSGGTGGTGYDWSGEPIVIYTYSLDDENNATITGYSGNATSLTIPMTLDDYNVTAIGDNVFKNKISLQTVIMQDNIQTIGNSAFYGCTNLRNVILSKNLVTLGGRAFYNCDGLTAIEIPKSLDETKTTYYNEGGWGYRYGVFEACDNLKTVTFEAGTTEVSVGLFARCYGLEEIVIPDTVTVIEQNAFWQCTGLKKVTLSNSLTNIQNSAFNGCSVLESINIPDTVTTIGTYVFTNNSALTTVHWPASLMAIPEYTFSGCTALTKIYLPDNLAAIHKHAFNNCDALVTFTMPDSVTTMNENVFYDCDALTDIHLSEKLQKINNSTFYNCDSLTSITIPYGIISIGSSAFYDCDALETVDMANSVTSLGSSAFKHCDVLKTVKLSRNLTAIPSEAFRECAELEEIVIPYFTTKIDSNAFNSSPKLKKVVTHEKLATINTSAFSYADRTVFYGPTDSYTNTWCTENGYSFVENTAATTKVTAAESSVTIPKGKTYMLDFDIDPIDFHEIITTKSSNTAVATVDEAGKITAVAPGTATIKIIVGGASASCKVTVTQAVTKITMNKTKLSLDVPETYQLTATITPSDASNKNLIWSSSNESAATVDGNGLVTAVGNGTAVIKAEATDGTGISASCTVTVIDLGKIPVSSITLGKTTLSLEAMETYQMTASVSPANAANKALIWTSSNEAVATVDSNGLVTAVAKGTATITATAADGYGASASCTVTVTNNGYVVTTLDQFQSSHPYANSCTDFWLYTQPGAGSVSITFDAETEMEDGFDYLYIYDGEGNLIGKYTGTELANQTITIPGDTVKVQIESDDSGNAWGFRVTDVDYTDHTHSFTNYVSDGNATCTEDGTKTAKCEHCDATNTIPDFGSALGHDMGRWETTVPATCTEDGEEQRTCSRCDQLESRVIEAVGHRWDKGIVTREPTEETEGERLYTCTACGATKTESIPVIGHEHRYEAVVTAPTCTERGYTTFTCKCGESYVADYVDALGHSFGGWTVIQEPTITEDGLEERSCIRCGHTEQRTIAKLENPFNDVAPGSFYYEPVMWAVENGITNGTSATTFGPNDQCMRAHVVTFLWRAVGSPEPTRTDNPFVDVKPGDFYYKPVLWAVENGITSGMDATHFGPTAYCNRAQVVTFLYRTMGNPDVDAASNPFTDVAVGSFYEKPVLWAVENGVTAGMSATSFGPNSICNRAQIVTFLYRAFVD